MVIQRRVVGPLHFDTSRTLGNLAVFIHLPGRHAEAARLLRPSLGELEQRLGQDHTEYLFVAATLGATLAELGRHDEAQTLLREVR